MSSRCLLLESFVRRSHHAHARPLAWSLSTLPPRQAYCVTKIADLKRPLKLASQRVEKVRSSFLLFAHLFFCLLTYSFVWLLSILLFVCASTKERAAAAALAHELEAVEAKVISAAAKLAETERANGALETNLAAADGAVKEAIEELTELRTERAAQQKQLLAHETAALRERVKLNETLTKAKVEQVILPKKSESDPIVEDDASQAGGARRRRRSAAGAGDERGGKRARRGGEREDDESASTEAAHDDDNVTDTSMVSESGGEGSESSARLSAASSKDSRKVSCLYVPLHFTRILLTV